MKPLRDYAALLGIAIHIAQFDCGQNWTFSLPGGGSHRDSFECGDEARFEQRVRRFLDDQPWLGEDDPRVGMEGTYVERRS